MDISKGVNFAVGQNLFTTSNLIGSCWPKALLFQSWGSLLVLFELGLSVVLQTNPVSRSWSFRSTLTLAF